MHNNISQYGVRCSTQLGPSLDWLVQTANILINVLNDLKLWWWRWPICCNLHKQDRHHHQVFSRFFVFFDRSILTKIYKKVILYNKLLTIHSVYFFLSAYFQTWDLTEYHAVHFFVFESVILHCRYNFDMQKREMENEHVLHVTLMVCSKVEARMMIICFCFLVILYIFFNGWSICRFVIESEIGRCYTIQFKPDPLNASIWKNFDKLSTNSDL